MYVGLGQDLITDDLLSADTASNPYNVPATVPVPSVPAANTATAWLNANAKTVLVIGGIGLGVILLMRLGR
jgi:hypothetical protein